MPHKDIWLIERKGVVIMATDSQELAEKKKIQYNADKIYFVLLWE